MDHDLISSCMDCIDHVLPYLEFWIGKLPNRPAWHWRDLCLQCSGRSELAMKEEGGIGALKDRSSYGYFGDVRLC